MKWVKQTITKPLLFSTIFIACLGFSNTVIAADYCVTPPTGLVGWWPGDGNADDISGTNDGTFNGSYVTGKVASAFAITAANFVTIPVPPSSALDPAQITVDAWVKANGSPGQFKYIIAKGANNGCNGGSSFALYTDSSSGLVFYVSNGFNFMKSADAGTGVWDGQWHFVAGTYDGTSVNLYVDGNLVAGPPAPGSNPVAAINYNLSDTNDLAIGNYLNCSGLNFLGTVDEVEIFNRALSQTEVASIYSADDKGKCKLLTVAIDIKPGSFPNCININNHGLIPVAILGSVNLDVTQIDTSTLKFNGLAVKVKTKQGPQCSVENANSDSYPDLVCHFVDSGSEWGGGNSTASLTGQLKDHTPIIGTDSICIVP